MGRWIRIGFLGGVLLLVVLYLSVHLVCNNPYLKNRFERTLEPTFTHPVDIGYVYLNWKLQFVLSRFDIGERNDRGRMPDPMVHIRDLRVHLDWFKLMTGRVDVARLGFARRMRFGYFGLELDDVGRVREMFRNLPPVPTRMDRWKIRLLKENGTPYLRFSGHSGWYEEKDAPLHFEIRRFQGKSADVSATLTVLPEPNFLFKVDRLRLPHRGWGLKGNHFSGRIRFHMVSGTPRIRTVLRGSPGKLRGRDVPPVRLRARLELLSDSIRLRTLQLDAQYLRSSWDGTLTYEERFLDLNGTFDLRLKHLTNRFLERQRVDYVRMLDPLRVQGEVRITGSMDDPRARGQARVDSTVLGVRFDGVWRRLALKDLEGTVARDGLVLKGGTVRDGWGSFRIEKGEFGLNQGSLNSTVRGSLEVLEVPGRSSPPKLPLVGRFRGAKGDLRVSGSVGAKHYRAELLLRGGELRFKNRKFTVPEIAASYGSSEPAREVLRGKLRDAEGNLWRVHGNPGDTLTLQSRPERVGGWLRSFRKRYPALRGVDRVSGVGVRLVVTNPMAPDPRYHGRIRFDHGRIPTGPNVPVLEEVEGTVRVGPGGIRVQRVGFRSIGGRWSLNGRVRPPSSEGKRAVDLVLRGKGLGVSTLLKQWRRSPSGIDLGGRCRVELSLRGKLGHPRVQGRLRSDRITVGGYRILQPRVAVRPMEAGTRWSLSRARFLGGRLQGTLRVVPGKPLEVQGTLNGVEPGAFFPGVDYIRNRVHGDLNLDLRTRGRASNLSSWTGKLVAKNDNTWIERFPSVEGLEKIARLETLEKRIDIQSGKHKFPLEEGKFNLNDFRLHAKDMELRGSGFVHLDGRLDTEFGLILRGDVLVSYFQDIFGEIYRHIGLSQEGRQFTVPFSVEGTVNNPKTEVDQDHIRKEFREDFVNSLLSERIGKPVNEILDELPFFHE